MKVRVKFDKADINFAEIIYNKHLSRMNRFIAENLDELEKQIGEQMSWVVKSSPFIDEFVNLTRLSAELGVRRRAERMQEILEIFNSHVKIVFTPFSLTGSTINPATLKIGLYDATYQNLLESTASYMDIVTSEGYSFRLDWVRWTLITGQHYEINGWEFAEGKFPNSRTGGGIMVQSPGSSWNVPFEYQGDPENNWITQAIKKNVDIYYNNIPIYFRRMLQQFK